MAFSMCLLVWGPRGFGHINKISACVLVAERSRTLLEAVPYSDLYSPSFKASALCPAFHSHLLPASQSVMPRSLLDGLWCSLNLTSARLENTALLVFRKKYRGVNSFSQRLAGGDGGSLKSSSEAGVGALHALLGRAWKTEYIIYKLYIYVYIK